MSIRARLIATFAALLVLLLVVVAVAFDRFDALAAKTQDMIDHQTRRAVLAQRLDVQAQDAAIYLLNLLQTPSRDDRVALYLAMDESIAQTDQTVSELRQSLQDTALQDDVAQVVYIRQRYSVVLQETVELLEIEGAKRARAHFENHTQKVLRTLIFDTQTLSRKLQQSMQTELEALNRSSQKARQSIVLLAVGALLCSVVLALAIARSVVKPVRDAVALAQSVAAGHYRDRVPSGPHNEMGVLLRALEAMRSSIASREDKIMRLAYVDQLTGLPNRTRLLELLTARASQDAGVLAVLDIDRFDAINKALGFAMGDRILCAVGERLQQAVEGHGVVARLWGDEFGIIFNAMDTAQANTCAQAVLTDLQRPLLLDTQRLDVSASVGLVAYGRGAVDPGALLRCANMAMALAKGRHDHLAFGDAVVDEPATAQLSLMGELRDALTQGQFVVYYQPKLALAQQRVNAAEALLRWQHPQRGLVPPMQFIPFAEQTGFIREVTPWILRTVIEQVAQWDRAGLQVVTSVNLSTRDLLCPNLVTDIKQLLAQYKLPPQLLCLEITESALMDDPAMALRQLQELADHGVALSIDDYGTGQASLAYVKSLPVSELKIDRTFVTAVDTSPRSAAIVRSTLLMCRDLGLKVVAEGAETAQELAWLMDAGCDSVQGFVVSRPLPQREFITWVTDFNGRGAPT